jgi:hypothetical protein
VVGNGSRLQLRAYLSSQDIGAMAAIVAASEPPSRGKEPREGGSLFRFYQNDP